MTTALAILATAVLIRGAVHAMAERQDEYLADGRGVIAVTLCGAGITLIWTAWAVMG